MFYRKIYLNFQFRKEGTHTFSFELAVVVPIWWCQESIERGDPSVSMTYYGTTWQGVEKMARRERSVGKLLAMHLLRRRYSLGQKLPWHSELWNKHSEDSCCPFIYADHT